jgi:general secretion pathway protein H
MMLMSAIGPKNNYSVNNSSIGRATVGRAAIGRATASGFTLLEVLVVLVIMAAMAGLLVLGFKDSPQQHVRREASDLAALLNAAADEAVLRGMELGLAIDNEGYRFVYFDAEKKQWLAAAEKILGPHKFTETLSVAVVLDGEHIDEQSLQRIRALSERSEDEKLRPLLLLLSSGEVTPFTLTLGYGDELKVIVSGDGFNPIAVQRG